MRFVSSSTHIPVVLPPQLCSAAALLAGIVVVLCGPSSRKVCNPDLLYKPCRHLNFLNASCRQDMYCRSLSIYYLAHASLAS